MTPAPLEIRLFGRGGYVQSGAFTPVPRDVLATLAYVALAPGPVARAAMLDDVWPGDGRSTAQQRLRRAVHTIERSLEALAPQLARVLLSERTTLALTSEAREFVDVVRFKRLARERTKIDAALALYRPELASGLEGAWIEAARAELEREYRALLVAAAQTCEARGELESALRHVRALRAGAPLDERRLGDELRLLAARGSRIEALDVYRTFARALRAEYDADPAAAVRAIYDRLRRDRNAKRRSLPAEPISFAGRERELDEIEAAFAHHRLVTLAGLPGAGKSRLALRAAAHLERRYFDGATFVDAGNIANPADIAATLAELERSLVTEDEVLIVFDDCRLRSEWRAAIAELCKRSAHVRVLATARAPLGLVDEFVIVVGPLDDAAARTVLSRYEKIDGTSEAARRILEASWSLPATLERAALRLRSTSVEELAALLDRDPSYVWPDFKDLVATLSPCALSVYLSLSIFEAGFAFSGARAVVDPDETSSPAERALRDAIAELCDCSLIVPGVASREERRFSMPAPLRRLAREALGDDALSDARRRYVAYYVRLFAESFDELVGANAGVHYGWLASDLENIRAVLRTAIQGAVDPAGGSRIAVALARFAGDKGYIAEFDGYLRTALAGGVLSGDVYWDAVETSARFALYLGDFERSYAGLLDVAATRSGPSLARVQNSLAVAARCLGRHEESLDWARRSRDGFAEAGDLANTGKASSSIATTLLVLDRVDESRRAFESALASYEAAGAKLDEAHTLVNVAVSSYFAGDLDAARRYNDRALEMATIDELIYVEALAHNNAALFDVADGAVASAAEHSRKGLALCRTIEDPEALANAVAAAAFVLLHEGEPANSAFGLAASEAALERLGASRTPVEERFVAGWRARLESALGPSRCERALAEGRLASLEAAGSRIEAALDNLTSQPA